MKNRYEAFDIKFEASRESKKLLKEIFIGYENRKPLNMPIEELRPLRVTLDRDLGEAVLKLEGYGVSAFCGNYVGLNLSITSLKLTNALRRLMESPSTVLLNNQAGFDFSDLVDFSYYHTLKNYNFLTRDQIDEAFDLYVKAVYATPKELEKIYEPYSFLSESYSMLGRANVTCKYDGKTEEKAMKGSIFNFLHHKNMIKKRAIIAVDSSGSNVNLTQEEENYGQWLSKVFEGNQDLKGSKVVLDKASEILDHSNSRAFSKIFKKKNGENLELEF